MGKILKDIITHQKKLINDLRIVQNNLKRMNDNTLSDFSKGIFKHKKDKDLYDQLRTNLRKSYGTIIRLKKRIKDD